MKINHSLQAAPETMNAEARAAVIGLQDGQQMRQDARRTRRSAQRDQICKMERVAEKMRTIAEQTRYKGFLAAGSELLSLTAKVCACAGQRSAAADTMSGVVKMINAADPFGAKIKQLEADKQQLETGAQAAGHHASDAAEELQQGQNLQQHMTSLMEKVLEARQRARDAMIKS